MPWYIQLYEVSTRFLTGDMLSLLSLLISGGSWQHTIFFYFISPKIPGGYLASTQLLDGLGCKESILYSVRKTLALSSFHKNLYFYILLYHWQYGFIFFFYIILKNIAIYVFKEKDIICFRLEGHKVQDSHSLSTHLCLRHY